MGLFSFAQHSRGVHSLKKDFDSDIEKYQEEIPVSDNLEKEFQKLQKLANNAFDVGFGIKYRFTYEDLKLELKEIGLPKETLDYAEEICSNMSEMEFDMTKITKQKLIDTSNSLLSLSAALRAIPEQDKKGFFGIFKKPEELPEKKHSEKGDIADIPIPEFNDVKIPLPTVIDKPVKVPEPIADGLLKKPMKFPVPEPVKPEKNTKAEKKQKKGAEEKKKEPVELPSFEVMELKQKENILKKDLTEIVKSLETGKKEIQQERELLEKKKGLIEKQKEQLKEFDLPAFKVFEGNFTNQLKDIFTKTKELDKKEKEIETRLKAVADMEAGLRELSKKLKKDEDGVNKRNSYLDAKEKVIKKIKEEMNNKYKKAMAEIETLKKELAEKEHNFLELQKFYQERENKLSVEEGNLLEEKRKHGRLVSGLLSKHIGVANHDLEMTEAKIGEISERLKKAETKEKQAEQQFRGVLREKNSLQKEIEEKQVYFAGIEEGFTDKDPGFGKTNRLLDARINNNIERESAAKKLEKELDIFEEQMRGKEEYLDVKELDIKALEKEIDRIKLDISSRETRVKLLEKHVNRRVDAYNKIKGKVTSGISQEKRIISLIQARLAKKGYYLSGKLKTLDSHEKIYDEYSRKLKEAGLSPEPDLFTDADMDAEVGNPSILDILRLLNIAKDYLSHNEKERARDAYLEIQRIFEDLNEDEREELYPEITKVFESRHSGFANIPEHFGSTVRNAPDYTKFNIDEMLSHFENSVNNSDYESTEQIYQKLQEKYSELSSEDKNRYYPRIIELYNRVVNKG